MTLLDEPRFRPPSPGILRNLFNPTFPNLAINRVMANAEAKIPSITHPEYDRNIGDWEKWRLVMAGGDDFNEEYIKKFSKRESNEDFRQRKELTPSACFAKAAVLEIKNSIFQRIVDVSRSSGPKTYLDSCAGELGGVDLKNSTMSAFLGSCVIEPLLAYKKVAVYVDSPDFGVSLKDKGNKHPYLYTYNAWDIRSWKHDSTHELSSVLLRGYQLVEDQDTGLPIGIEEEYRLLKKLDSGKVLVRVYDPYDVIKTEVELNLPKLPLRIIEISHSLLKDIANHQIALANLASSDFSYCAKANIPFYTEQVDNANTPYIKAAQQQGREILDQGPDTTIADNAGLCSTQDSVKENIAIGATQGRQYGKGMERPGFIAPPTDPLKASMDRQEKWQNEVRQLVHLAVANQQPRSASKESKEMDNQGLEAGLSYIGLELQQAERDIAEIWALYEGSKERTTISYPKRWSLKTDKDINDELEVLGEIRDEIPSVTFQREITKQMARTKLQDKVSTETMSKILKEIDDAVATTADVETIKGLVTAGLLGEVEAARVLGIKDPEKQVKQAREDHAERAARILKAQTKPGSTGGSDPAARGVPALSSNLNASKDEKQNKPGRGPGRNQ